MKKGIKSLFIGVIAGAMLLALTGCGSKTVEINGSKYYRKSLNNISVLIPEGHTIERGDSANGDLKGSCTIGNKGAIKTTDCIVISTSNTLESVKEKIETGLTKTNGEELTMDVGYGYTGCRYFVETEDSSNNYSEAWLYTILEDGTVLTVNITSDWYWDYLTSDEVKVILESIEVNK